MLVVAMLFMLAVAIVPALAQDGEFDVITTEEPVATCAWGPTEFASPENPYAPNALDPSDTRRASSWLPTSPWRRCGRAHRKREGRYRRLGWYETDTGTVYYPIPSGTQVLYFEDIANIPTRARGLLPKKLRGRRY
jgi:hypothetical protein